MVCCVQVERHEFRWGKLSKAQLSAGKTFMSSWAISQAETESEAEEHSEAESANVGSVTCTQCEVASAARARVQAKNESLVAQVSALKANLRELQADADSRVRAVEAEVHAACSRVRVLEAELRTARDLVPPPGHPPHIGLAHTSSPSSRHLETPVACPQQTSQFGLPHPAAPSPHYRGFASPPVPSTHHAHSMSAHLELGIHRMLRQQQFENNILAMSRPWG